MAGVPKFVRILTQFSAQRKAFDDAFGYRFWRPGLDEARNTDIRHFADFTAGKIWDSARIIARRRLVCSSLQIGGWNWEP